MCLGIPMQIIDIRGFDARCQTRGIERNVSLFMLQHETIATGDWVVVHVGYAIQKVDPQEARSAWELQDKMMSNNDHA